MADQEQTLTDLYSESMAKMPELQGRDERWTEETAADFDPRTAADPTLIAPEFDPDTDENYGIFKEYNENYSPEHHQHLLSFGIPADEWNNVANEMLETQPELKDAIEENVTYMVANGFVTEEEWNDIRESGLLSTCLLYTSPSPRDS